MKNMYVLLQFFDELSGPTTYRILSKEILGAEGKERKKIPKSLNDDFKVSDKQLILKKKLMQYFGKLFNAANLGYFLHHFEGRDKFSSANYYFIIYRPQIQIKEFYLMLSVILPFSEDPNQ